MNIIDLRSDTVTLPTLHMRKAIFDAELGDDVYGEDPTTNRLEELSSQRLGTEAALLVPSGTMANLISVLCHCDRGTEAILGDQAHIFYYECGSMAAVGGVHPHVLPNQKDGTIRLEDIEKAIRLENVHFPHTKLICLENTHNRCKGAVLNAAYIDSVVKLAKKHDIAVHMDGARIFNAAVALGVDVKELVKNVDSVSFCLSKGLSAPVGSIICGSEDFIYKARRIRKSVGGGMRQTGIIAAAGIVALEQMVDRLVEDHDNARKLGKGIDEIDGLSIDLSTVQSNMVSFSLDTDKRTAEEMVQHCLTKGVSFLNLDSRSFRMVTHYGITSSDIDKALEIISSVMKTYG